MARIVTTYNQASWELHDRPSQEAYDRLVYLAMVELLDPASTMDHDHYRWVTGYVAKTWPQFVRDKST